MREGQLLPWGRTAAARKGRVWQHTVYAGVFEVKRYKEALRDIFRAPPDPALDGRAPTGHSALLCLTVNQARLRLVAVAVLCMPLACCASTGSSNARPSAYPPKGEALRQGEVYINRLLISTGLAPTTRFEVADGPCNETDAEHGDVVVADDVQGTFTPEREQELLHEVGTAMQRLGLGTPAYEANAGPSPDGVAVSIGSYSVVFVNSGGALSFSVQSCYSTPAPTDSPGTAGVMRPIYVSPAPTSIATDAADATDAAATAATRVTGTATGR